LVFIEAMKQSLPVIGRANAGIDGMGVRGMHYELVDEDSQLPVVLGSLMNDNEKRNRLALAGRELASSWTWCGAARETGELYKRLLASA